MFQIEDEWHTVMNMLYIYSFTRHSWQPLLPSLLISKESALNINILETLLSFKFSLSTHPANSYVEALTSHVTVFGYRTFKEIIKFKWDYKGGALILKRRRRDTSLFPLSPDVWRKGHVKAWREGDHLQTKKRGLRKPLYQYLDLRLPAFRTVKK